MRGIGTGWRSASGSKMQPPTSVGVVLEGCQGPGGEADRQEQEPTANVEAVAGENCRTALGLRSISSKSDCTQAHQAEAVFETWIPERRRCPRRRIVVKMSK